ncbi:DUF2141 domain-containing protein [Endozoicomonadaceae bacterium StTr2]
MLRYLFITLLASLPFGLQAAELDVELTGIRNSQGNILISVFNNAAAFNAQAQNNAEIALSQKAQQGTMKFRFTNLNPGDYALMVHHDENGDGVVNMSGRIPTEGYAFSGGKGRSSVPTFDQARLHVGNGENREVISVIYLKK